MEILPRWAEASAAFQSVAELAVPYLVGIGQQGEIEMEGPVAPNDLLQSYLA